MVFEIFGLFSYETIRPSCPVFFLHPLAGVADAYARGGKACHVMSLLRVVFVVSFALMARGGGWGVKRFVDARGANADAGWDKRC